MSDTGVAGLAGGSSYTGGFSQTFTGLLRNGNAPTPQNMQLYFCPSGTCIAADFASGKSVTTSQSGSFTSSAAVLGDYNHNGTVDAADYVVWRKDSEPPTRKTITTCGAPTSGKLPVAAQVPLRMPQFPNQQRWCC